MPQITPSALVLALILFAFSGSAAHADAEARAVRAVQDGAVELGLQPGDIDTLEITDSYRSAHNGVHHVYLRQRIEGLAVINGVGNVNLIGDGRIASLHSRFATRVHDRRTARQPAVNALDALEAFALHQGVPWARPAAPLSASGPESLIFAGAPASEDPIPVELAWLDHDGRLKLVWQIVINSTVSSDWWQGWVDAHAGEVIGAANWTQHASYHVFPLPLESPAAGESALVVEPADGDASPLGWHDTGTTQYTDTRGNNVLAQQDLAGSNNPNVPRPDGGLNLTFDFPIDLDNDQPIDYVDFAVVNLFYWNNILHDVLWHYGFNEPAGNFQHNNFGLGGLDGDAVRADAQDGSGTNNANFSSPPDGSPGRMQMFVWTNPAGAELEVLKPGGIAGSYLAAPATFGGAITTTGINGDMAGVDDGSGQPGLGCQPLQGFPAGHIALVDRGDCEFGVKALNAQNAGATAVIVVNSDPGNGTIAMGGGAVGNQVNLPVAMIGNQDGVTLRDALDQGINATLRDTGEHALDRDSDLDAGVIAHEYGHGLSVRLTGGPSNSSCLSSFSYPEQPGEGWSDFVGLFVTARPGENQDTPRGVGSYLIFQSAIPGAGIRVAPYTRDMSRNPLTYQDLAGGNLSIPHGIGTVFASTAWDMYWNLVNRYGFDPDLYRGQGGNNIAMQLITDGLKLQPCGPSFLDVRDAILLADDLLYDGAHQCEIWEAFGRRGMGVGADDGGSAENLDVTEDFTIPEHCAGLGFADLALVAAGDSAFESPGDTASLTFTISNPGGMTLSDVTLAGDGLEAALCSPGLPAELSASESVTCTLEITLTQSDVDAGSRTIAATAGAFTPGGIAISAGAGAILTGPERAPALALHKAAALQDGNENGIADPGEIISYTLTATNAGNVTLRNMEIIDEMLDTLDCDVPAPADLAPLAVVVCTGEYEVTAADVENGTYLGNTASAQATDPEGETLQTEASAHTPLVDGTFADRFEAP